MKEINDSCGAKERHAQSTNSGVYLTGSAAAIRRETRTPVKSRRRRAERCATDAPANWFTSSWPNWCERDHGPFALSLGSAQVSHRVIERGRRLQQRSGDKLGTRRTMKAIDRGKPSAPGKTAGPKSVSSRKSWSASARTIFGRAFQGEKRVIVDAPGKPICTGRTNDPSSEKLAKTDAFSRESADGAQSTDAELTKPMQSARRVGQMANIPLPHEEPVEIKRV
jgi:hypothetical protein